jgi:serine/threonine-protein kinase RsbW
VGSPDEHFEFHATLSHLDEGLETLHKSVMLMRESLGWGPDDPNVMRFEIALAEIGANVLTHGRPAGADHHVDYELVIEHESARASFVDPGPPMEDSVDRGMPDPSSESGRGLAMASTLLDELGYERDGQFNRWWLVKRL